MRWWQVWRMVGGTDWPGALHWAGLCLLVTMVMEVCFILWLDYACLCMCVLTFCGYLIIVYRSWATLMWSHLHIYISPVFSSVTVYSLPLSSVASIHFKYLFFFWKAVIFCGAVVCVWVCEPRVLGLIPRYPLATFHSLVLPPSGQRLPKLLLYCPQMGLTMFICIWGCSSNKPLMFSTYSRRHYKKSKNLRQITSKRQSIFTFRKSLWFPILNFFNFFFYFAIFSLIPSNI